MSLLLYRFDSDVWSEPLVIDADYEATIADIWPASAPKLADAGLRVLATWRTRHGLMARWIDLPPVSATKAKGDGLAWLRIRDLRAPGDAITRLALNQPMPPLAFTVPEEVQVRHLLNEGLKTWMQQHPGWSPRDVECEILTFKVHAPSNLLSWKATAEVQLRLRSNGREHLLSGAATQRTSAIGGPTVPFVESVMADALQQVASALPAAADALLLTPSASTSPDPPT
ncbi:MAG TPA: hypothetical protein VJ484_13115 [Lysobacter sp.]|nr:hypothetical protein [Lysobacter sp.]